MRIISLCPSLTELVFDLGRGDDLVGITKFCVHPAALVGAIEKVGGTKDPLIDRIRELQPDVVLFNQEENRKQDHDQLLEAGIHVCNSFPKNALETAQMVRFIGAELEREHEAQAIATDIEQRVARVLKAAVGQPRVRFAYFIWRKPWMSVNGDTFASSMLEQAGAVNVFAALEDRYPVVKLEDLTAANVDLILLCTEPFVFKQKHIEEVALATGVASDRILIADGEYLSWHGSRTPAGVDYAAAMVAGAR
ncbi:MAG: iron complex transport system substrate-binding protein [Candidatus Paceibacteria bacterium]|jgi:iron complex transport system substrate-binding protein